MLFDELMSRPSERKLRKVVKKWWNIYENNKKLSLDHLSMIMLFSAGIKHETFDLDTFPDEFLKKNLFSEDTNLSDVPISLQLFSKTLNRFIDILLQRKFWAVIQDKSFIFALVSVIEFMRRSPLDSVRAVSYLSGMKILRQSYSLHEYLMTVHILDKTNVIRSIEEIKNKVFNCFRYSMRDKAAHLRTIPLNEILSWSKENPDAMIEEYLRGYILRGLSDSYIGNRKLTLNIFCIIFEKPSVNNAEQQLILFKRLIPELTMSLRNNEELDFLILKIVNRALKFLNVVVTPLEDLHFSMCLYSKSESVLEEAKTYFYKKHFQGKTGVNIILETFKFYSKCPVKDASKLVQNLMLYFANHTTWQDWEFCLKLCFDNDINDYLNIFFLYTSLINNQSLNVLDASTTSKMKDEFSIYFSECWLQLMEKDKVAMNSKAQVLMLKLVTFFNVMKLFKKTQAEIIKWSLNCFQLSTNHEVLKECLLCFKYLNSFNKNIELEKFFISQVLTEFVELLNSENEESEMLYMSYYKVYLLVKVYENGCEDLWGLLESLLGKIIDLERVQLIISLLYHLVMNKMKKYVEFKNQSEFCSEDLLSIEEKSFQGFLLKSQLSSCCVIVIHAASKYIHNSSSHINQYDKLAEMMLVPKLYGEMIHLSKCPLLTELFLELTEANVETYVVYCCRIMNIDCQGKGPLPSGSCCIVLNNYAVLTMEGNVCISYLKYFIANFDKINSHWLIILKIFNFLINVKSNPIVAFAVINGLISLYNGTKEKLVDEETIKSKFSEITFFILNNVHNVKGKGHQKTVLHLYLYLEKLVNEGYIIFLELKENVKSYLSEKIRNKLVSENPQI